MSAAGDLREGTVRRLDARGCLVHLDEAPGAPGGGAGALWCSVRGRIHLRSRTHQKSPVVAGDRVRVRRTGPDRGTVEEVEPRRSTLSRPAIGRGRVEHVMAANVDQVAVVTAAEDPEFTPGLVDRVLAVVEYSHLEGLLVVNKIDLVPHPPAGLEAYRALGYPVLLTSAVTGAGLDALRARLAGRVTVVAGHSGVGKSSLLNALDPALDRAVRDVNAFTGRGTHTTTAAEWIPLTAGGAVIDTAGVREFGLWGIPARDVSWLFRDLARVAPGCRYPDCRHRTEPGCAVRDAVGRGAIAASRYESYLRILEDVEERATDS